MERGRVVMLVLALSACGYSAKGSEVIGQVKKVAALTPLICPDYQMVDLSLGVMRNGVGSMSTEDIWIVVTPFQAEQFKKLQRANAVVRVTYDTNRIVFCPNSDRVATFVEEAKP